MSKKIVRIFELTQGYARHDYLPFGEEILPPDGGRSAGQSGISTFGTADGVYQRFTGKERDSETGLDFFAARYTSSAQGRFTSPDPSNLSVDFYLPLTWNRYSYVLNNPLAMVDQNGLWPWPIHNQIISQVFPA